MQSGNKKSFLNFNQKSILILFFTFIINSSKEHMVTKIPWLTRDKFKITSFEKA